ncbi:hypothetical protein PAECIP111893_04962 [Paenibacillus plantiphilus]|uniref:Spore coat protein n=1 Tax=Paenibacillus plantiphilus TaxID=2905650 RepID=A0ABN8GZT9_9BACL|nr:hypothetical protein [Paenibacillus plantiphilus]CAH1223352.1 hypothetical protein PAECIP111893_04962 [Paenibacillus plantiphilus]
MMQPITAKELEYVVDSISNEDLLMKQCAVVVAAGSSPALKQVCGQMIHMHEQHMHTLLHSLQQHQQLAPTQPQN